MAGDGAAMARLRNISAWAIAAANKRQQCGMAAKAGVGGVIVRQNGS
jgi:hypothetical protein